MSETCIVWNLRPMTESEESHINLDAARSPEQEAQYKAIHEAGVCPFCPEHYREFDYQEDPISESEHWYTIANMKPYDYTSLHNVIIARRHLLSPDELTNEEWLDLKHNLDREIRTRKLGYGALGMRFGDPVMTGASVRHLHMHLVVPDPMQVSDLNVVKFRMSQSFKRSK